MSSRTPIRLTPHRGPLATPSNSPESSPTLSSPPSDISFDATDMSPMLDIAILQYQISSPPSPPTRFQCESRLHSRRREVTRQGLFGHRTHLSPLALMFESLIYSASELATTLAAIITLCLLIWGLLEFSSYTPERHRQSGPWISMSRPPLPSHTRALCCHVNPSLCEPTGQHVAVLQFLSEQIQHAKALSSLSAGLGLPLRTFLAAHQAIIPSVMVRRNSTELLLVQEVDTWASLMESLDPSVLDFTSGGFVGRSFTHALEELGDLISKSTVSRRFSRRGELQEVHLNGIYWRTASNLLLEYSSARPRIGRLLQHLHALHQQLSPLVSSYRLSGEIEGRLNTWWWNGIARHPTSSIEDGMQAFVTGLEVTLDNVHRLVAYIDWITEQLAQTTLRDVLKTKHSTDFSSCMVSLQELFARSNPPTPKKHCFCLNDYRVMPAKRPEKVEILVPGSPTARAER